MDNILPFSLPVKEETTPHLSGRARCFKCKYRWIAVAPLGTCVLTCPQCSCDGFYIGAVVTDGDQWNCNCSSDIFRKDMQGFYCPCCGARHQE